MKVKVWSVEGIFLLPTCLLIGTGDIAYIWCIGVGYNILVDSFIGIVAISLWAYFQTRRTKRVLRQLPERQLSDCYSFSFICNKTRTTNKRPKQVFELIAGDYNKPARSTLSFHFQTFNFFIRSALIYIHTVHGSMRAAKRPWNVSQHYLHE